MELKKDKYGTFHTLIVDEEGDGIRADFHNDNCVQLDTSNYTYIALSTELLIDLVDMIGEAEIKYIQKKKKDDDEHN